LRGGSLVEAPLVRQLGCGSRIDEALFRRAAKHDDADFSTGAFGEPQFKAFVRPAPLERAIGGAIRNS
jgi:hypothetical protein